jgi:hypothetical protein
LFGELGQFEFDLIRERTEPDSRRLKRASDAPNPARRVRSRIIARSNSANAPTICIIIRPGGVVVLLAAAEQEAGQLLTGLTMVRTAAVPARTLPAK